MTDSNFAIRLGLTVAGSAALGFYFGKKVGAKRPESFRSRVERATSVVSTISADQALSFVVTDSPLIIDVRDSGTIGDDAIKGSVNIPLSTLVFAGDQSLTLPSDVRVKGQLELRKGTSLCHPKLLCPKDTPMLLSCSLGWQSLIGAEILVDYGFTNVKVVSGGNVAWTNAGGPVCNCLKFPIVATCAVSPQGKACSGGAEDSRSCLGAITLTQTCADECIIEYGIYGLEPGKHGFHVHEKADFSKGCASAGPTYNPFNKTHGAPEDDERHVGDLGNIVADASGTSKGIIVDRFIKLEGEHSVVGRSMMIHADPDDLGRGDNSQSGVNGKCSKETGNVGAPIACGEIKLSG